MDTNACECNWESLQSKILKFTTYILKSQSLNLIDFKVKVRGQVPGSGKEQEITGKTGSKHKTSWLGTVSLFIVNKEQHM